MWLQKNPEKYVSWYEIFFKKSVTDKVPFTGLGYTYNWNYEKTDGIKVKGMSEYILRPGADIYKKGLIKFNDNGYITNICI